MGSQQFASCPKTCDNKVNVAALFVYFQETVISRYLSKTIDSKKSGTVISGYAKPHFIFNTCH